MNVRLYSVFLSNKTAVFHSKNHPCNIVQVAIRIKKNSDEASLEKRIYRHAEAAIKNTPSLIRQQISITGYKLLSIDGVTVQH